MRTQAERPYRSFVLGFLVFYFLFPASLASFNYAVDPGHRHRLGVTEEMLATLNANPNLLLTMPSNNDDRALLKKAMRQFRSPSILLLGGSRVLNIRSELFQAPYDGEFFNAGVTSGTIRDYVALWQMAKRAGFRPSTVIIGLEEQSMNGDSQNDAFLSILEFYEDFFQRGLSPRVRWMGLAADWKDLLSLKTTQASLKAIFSKSAERIELVSPAERDGRCAARTHSFSLLYPEGYESKGASDVRAEGAENGRGELKALGRWNRSERRWMDHLAALLRDIRSSGARAVVVGMPYHPEASRMIAGDVRAREGLADFVAQLRRTTLDEGALFYDAILEYANFREDDFADGVHLKWRAAHKLFRQADRELGLGLTGSDPSV